MGVAILLGANIRRLRLEKQMSQTKFSKYLNIHQESLSRIEHGKFNPSLKTLENIANILDVPLYKLFDDEAINTESDTY